MTASGSYQFESLESRHSEASLMHERAHMRLEGFLPLLERHRFPPAGRVLDVGCGHGLRSRLIAEHFPAAQVVGLDRSEELLSLARGAGGAAGAVEYVAGDLYAPPFADGSFDFVYARLVFMHLTDPARALASLRRVLRPGGILLIEDADRDCMHFEPAPASFAAFWRRVQDGQRRLGGDPNVGRKLASYLKGAAFASVAVEVQPLLGGAEEIKFLARTLLPSLNIYAEPEARADGEAAIADLVAMADDPAAMFYHFWFVVSGQKPLCS